MVNVAAAEIEFGFKDDLCKKKTHAEEKTKKRSRKDGQAAASDSDGRRLYFVPSTRNADLWNAGERRKEMVLICNVLNF